MPSTRRSPTTKARRSSAVARGSQVVKGDSIMIVSSPERTGTTEASTPEPEPGETFTAEELLEVIRSACIHMDPNNAGAYHRMDASHVRQAVRVNARLLKAHREYQRRHR